MLSDVLAMIDKVLDVHIASVRPGAARGNHYHSVKAELITVVYSDAAPEHHRRSTRVSAGSTSAQSLDDDRSR
jgi:uncharacterized cupin superfamily protein